MKVLFCPSLLCRSGGYLPHAKVVPCDGEIVIAKVYFFTTLWSVVTIWNTAVFLLT